MTPRALYIGTAEPAFAMYHPSGGSGCAVLFCPPYGWDDICSYRSRRLWAERLAAVGHPTLRFDLPGTGDSGGAPEDEGRLPAWLRTTEEAAFWLAEASGGRAVAAIGIGLGGILALAAAGCGAIDHLVLWGVPADGQRLVRELRALARFEAGAIGAAGGPPAPTDTPVAPGGFLLTRQTQQALEALGAEQLQPQAGQRVLLLGRDGAVDRDLRARFQRLQADVSVAPGNGYGAMMSPPDLARPPLVTFDVVEEWLENVGSARLEARAAYAPPSEKRLVLLGTSGPPVVEYPLEINEPGERLFGIVAEPAETTDHQVALILLNAGAIRRIGPSRLWVDYARRWSSRGALTVRLDLEGLGDSSGSGLNYSSVSELYVPRLVRQVEAAVSELAVRRGIKRAVLLGLCSGAYWSFHAALADSRVTTAVMLNPRILHWHPRLDAVRDARTLRRRARSAVVLRQAIPRGRSDFARVAAVARWGVSVALSRERDPVEKTLRQAAQSFETLNERGQNAVLIFCDGEPLCQELEAAQLLPNSERWPNVELVKLPGRDHTFRPLWMHEPLRIAVDAALSTALLQR